MSSNDIDVTDYIDFYAPDSLVSPPEAILTPKKPNDEQKKIANKVEDKQSY